MLTKGDFLKAASEDFEKYLDGDIECKGKPVYRAMEDYAKQEVFAFYEWFVLHRDDKNLHEFPSRDNTWSCYQSHKASEALKTVAANQPN